VDDSRDAITFLFTDIEGSTRLWERAPEAMRTALARHDSILRSSVEHSGGKVFKTIGDAFCAAFPSADGAVRAALDIQMALHTEAWSETGPIRVRVALHTGEAETRDDDFFGPTVNRAARLLAVGHGQQTLLSNATFHSLSSNLPDGVTLLDLGLHRLKDLAAPEHIRQIAHPNLVQVFPPLRSLDYLPTNLPRQTTSFIGRTAEMEAIRSLLETSALVTLTGAGGTGKTRLAIQVGAELLDQFPDGVWLVELAPISDPALLPQAAALVLGEREESGRPVMESLIDQIKDRTALLILDNCEHLLDAAARFADEILRSCPGFKILATSREGLNIAGERPLRIPSLALPETNGRANREDLLVCESAVLFEERARAVQSGFSVTEANATAVATLCRRLDGIPLAIELAAARVHTLPVEQIAARLDDRFRLLTGGSRTALPRQQTLRALIDWSYGLLTADEQALLCRLSVFSGGWSLEAAEHVVSDPAQPSEPWILLDQISALVAKSLVVFEDDKARYKLLETVRQYARDRLLERGESALFRRWHRDYFLGIAESAEPELRGRHQAEWLGTLETEHDNLRAALEWCLAEPAGETQGVRLAGALAAFWQMRGFLTEGREWLEQCLSNATSAVPSVYWIKAKLSVGELCTELGDYEIARSHLEECLSRCEAVSDLPGLANTYGYLGNLDYQQGDYESARVRFEHSQSVAHEARDGLCEAFALNYLGNLEHMLGNDDAAEPLYQSCLTAMRAIGDRSGVAMALNNLGNLAIAARSFETAIALYEESLAIRREARDSIRIAGALNNLGIVYYGQGDYSKAKSHHEESLAIRRKLSDRRGIGMSLHNLALVLYRQGDLDTARAHLVECVRLLGGMGHRSGVAEALPPLAAIEAVYGNHARAAMLWGAAENLFEEIGAAPQNDWDSYDQETDVARKALGELAFNVAWRQGRDLTAPQVIDLMS
jgi:predicted ATPase/class 3 adenylate cyclase